MALDPSNSNNFEQLVLKGLIDCLERLVSEMTCYVSSGTLNPTHSLKSECVGFNVPLDT